VERGNVLVIGNSGVGKSTLINAVLGEDMAETGWGTEGTTKELRIYENKDIAFRIIDTAGFEPSTIKAFRAISAVKNGRMKTFPNSNSGAREQWLME
jgi:small GTP-binding protein